MKFFLKFKKIPMLLMLSHIFLETNCHAGRHNESNEEGCCSRTLRKLSNVFSCLFRDCIGDSVQYHYREISDYDEDYEIEGLATTENQPIDMLPSELLYQVAVFLSPPDIISLINSNKNFSCLRRNNFWLYYNKEHNYYPWNEEIPAIKVAFSYYWFRNNKVRNSAAMGFPKALAFLKQQEKLKRECSSKSYEISTYGRKDPYDELMRRKFFYKKYW